MAQVGLGGRVAELRISARLDVDPCGWSSYALTWSLDLRALLEGRDEKPEAELGLVTGREDGGEPVRVSDCLTTTWGKSLPYSGRREDDRLLIRRRPRCLTIVGHTGIFDLKDYDYRRVSILRWRSRG